MYRGILILLLEFILDASTQFFPIHEHLNITVEQASRGYQYLCNSPTRTFGLFCCSCEDECFKTRNCCIDKIWNTKENEPLADYYKKFLLEAEKSKSTTCEYVFPLADKYKHESKMYFMISKCQQGSTQEEVDACNNVKQLEAYEYTIPVFGNDLQLYQSTQCARCNSLKQFQMVNITAHCSSMAFQVIHPNIVPPPVAEGQTTTTTTTTTPAPVKLTERFKQCKFTIDESKSLGIIWPNINRCELKTYRKRDNCKSTSKYYELCHSYYGIMGTYANYHCYLCEKDSNVKIPEPYYTCPDNFKGRDQLDWSFTLSFSSQTNVNIKGPGVNLEETYCSNNKLYNPFKGTCDEFQCATGYEVSGTTCEKALPVIEPLVTVVTSPSYDKCLLQQNNIAIIVVNKDTANMTQVKNALKVIDTTDIKINEIHQINNLTYYETNVKINNFTEFNTKVSDGAAIIWQSIVHIYIAESNQIVTELHGLDISRTFNNKLCANPKIYQNMQYNFTSLCTLSINNSSLTRQNYSQWISYDKTLSQRKISVCDYFYLHSSCKLTTINTNYSISTENQTLTVGNKTFAVSQYAPLKKGLGVCNTVKPTVNSIKYSWMETKEDWEFYISIVGTCLSIICYIIIIITYLYFKELRIIPGLTIVGLCVTLLCTDILFLVATQVSNDFLTCKVVGIMLHWGLLAIQSWILVMAFDLLSRFGSVGIAAPNSPTKRFIQYSLFVVLLPTIIVTVPVILNEYNIYDIGYGENGIGFIYYQNPRIYFYIIPIATSLLLTGVSFARSLLMIRNSEKKARTVLLNSGRQKNNLVAIALKMVLVLGLIEIAGFIQIRKDQLTESDEIFNAVFSMVYVLSRSLRGVILAVVYICKKQKWELYRKHLGYSKEEIKSKATQMSEMSSSHM